MNSRNTKTLAFLALAAASIIWGANGAVMKAALEHVPLFSLAFIRFGVASILLYLLFRPKLHIKREDLSLVVLCALIGITFHISLYFWGIRLTKALNAGIIEASLPLLTLFVLWVVFHRSISRNLLIGGVIGLLGILIIIGNDIMGMVHLSPVGDLLIVAAMLTFVIYELGLKRLFRSYEPLTITFYSFAIGGGFFLPATISEYINNPNWIAQLPPSIYLNILYGILLSSLAAHACWQWGLSKVPVAKVGFFLYLGPIASTIAAVLILSEKVTPPFILGAAFILIGLFLAESHVHYHPHVSTKIIRRQSKPVNSSSA